MAASLSGNDFTLQKNTLTRYSLSLPLLSLPPSLSSSSLSHPFFSLSLLPLHSLSSPPLSSLLSPSPSPSPLSLSPLPLPLLPAHLPLPISPPSSLLLSLLPSPSTLLPFLSPPFPQLRSATFAKKKKNRNLFSKIVPIFYHST